MAYPDLLTYRGSGELQVMSSTELNAVAEIVLEKLMSDDGVGSLQATNPSSNYTSIGTFVDNYIVGDPGDSDTTLTSEDKIVYQNLDATSVGSEDALPVTWTGTEVKEAVSNDLADEIINYMITNDGPGTYHLGTSAPSDGGTWTAAFPIYDKLSTSNNASPVSYIWAKTAGTTSLYTNTLKTITGGLQYFTTAEIESLVALVKERIIDTGIGQYALSVTAPATGTWEARGTITDGYYVVEDGTYTGVGSTVYTGARAYTGSITYQYYEYYGPYEPGNVSGFNGSTYYGPITVIFDFTGYYDFTGFAPTDYYGPLVGSTTTSDETVTLWRRIA